MNIFSLMKFAIVIVAISTLLLELRKIVKLGFHWITASVIAVSLFWAVYYMYQIIRIYFNMSLPDHRVYVRSGILLSLTVFLAKAIRVNKEIK